MEENSLERLSVNSGPVGKAAEHETDEDKVTTVGSEGPFQTRIVDLEAAVCGDERGLDGGEVCADYFCRREMVCNIAIGISVQA